jgi:hypothetical protein
LFSDYADGSLTHRNEAVPHSSLIPLAQGGPKQTVEVGRFSMPKPART